MYLSRIILPESYDTIRFLGNWHALHTIIFTSCAYEPSRILFRLDKLIIIIQSAIEPKWRLADWPVGTKFDIPKILPNIGKDYRLRYKLRANPTKQSNCKREGIINREELIRWINKKGEFNGFKILECQLSDEGQFKFERNNCLISLRSILFEGILQVIDDKLFNNVIVSGIGSGKAWGFGLLSVARL